MLIIRRQPKVSITCYIIPEFPSVSLSRGSVSKVFVMNNYHSKNVVLRLALKERLRGTRKWSIGFNRMVHLYRSASCHWLYFDCFCRAWNQTIYVDLWDTEGDSEVHINKMLIEKGFARETDHTVNNPWNMEGTQSHQKMAGLPG